MKKRNKIIGIIAINILLLLLVFFLTEAIFRLAGIPYKVQYIPSENSYARFDPELGWSYIPDKSTTHKAGDIEKPIHLDTNGIRVPAPDYKLSTSRPSVLFIGGSFTMGHGLSYEESFAGRLAVMKDMPLQVVNLGVQGYGSDQSLLSLKHYLTKFNTKIVVYTFIEDHIFRNGNYDRRMLIPTARFLGTKPMYSLDDKQLYLAKKPALYKDLYKSYVIDFIKIRTGSLIGSFPPYPEDVTKAIIQEMSRFCKENGAHFVVLNWRWSEGDYDSLFKDIDVNVIDTLKDAPKGWDKMVLLEGMHPDAEASIHAAHLLFEYLRKNDLLSVQGNRSE